MAHGTHWYTIYWLVTNAYVNEEEIYMKTLYERAIPRSDGKLLHTNRVRTMRRNMWGRKPAGDYYIIGMFDYLKYLGLIP